jgi:tetratricopeptide (TPR) repeat protein
MISKTAGRTVPQIRLDSWKSIAQYLDRSTRTVQRWHSNYGMPVHHVGGDAGSVFIFANEIDEWLKKRSQMKGDEPAECCMRSFYEKPFAQGEQCQNVELLSVDRIPSLQALNSQELVAYADKMRQSLSASDLGVIAQIYRRAAALDPANARAFAGLSLTLILEDMLGCVQTTISSSCAKDALRQAMEIDSELIEVQRAVAWFKMVIARDWEGARQIFDDILSRRADDSTTLIGRALIYVAEGCFSEALNIFLKIIERYPLRTSSATLFSWCSYLTGQYKRALDWNALVRKLGHVSAFLNTLEILISIQLEGPCSCVQRIECLPTDSPLYSVPRGILGYTYGVTGQVKKARQVLNTFVDSEAQVKPHHAYSMALTLIGLDEEQKAVEWLERSYRYGSFWSFGFLFDPILTPLRSGPYYQKFLSKVVYPKPENLHSATP